VTDSTYAICSYKEKSNYGEIEVFNSELKGDTLLVYDILSVQKSVQNDTSIYRLIIVEAYLIKRRRLYPIYWEYPTIYPKSDFKYYYSGQGEYLGKRDDSRVKKFSVDWDGAQSDIVYTNSRGVYHKSGKFKGMRRMLRFQNDETDSTLWEIKAPTKYVNETLCFPTEWMVMYGTLKTKKGEFIDLK
jgi:hypothetical protein